MKKHSLQSNSILKQTGKVRIGGWTSQAYRLELSILTNRFPRNQKYLEQYVWENLRTRNACIRGSAHQQENNVIISQLEYYKHERQHILTKNSEIVTDRYFHLLHLNFEIHHRSKTFIYFIQFNSLAKWQKHI